jgi:hypothetical protein
LPAGGFCELVITTVTSVLGVTLTGEVMTMMLGVLPLVTVVAVWPFTT